MTKIINNKQRFFVSFAAVFLSVFMVAVVTYGATTINTSSVAVATTTPGAALAVKGEAIVEGFVHADYFKSTSTNPSWTMGRFGIGTTTVSSDVNNDGGLAVAGGAIIGDFIYTSYITATSTTATSSVRYGFGIASSSLLVDGLSGAVSIGTTTWADADVTGTLTIDPSLTVGAVGAAQNATATVYIAGEGGNGGQIILRSSNGANCISIMADSVANAVGAVGGAADFLSVDVVECPK
ncbi:MAG: hypothetical protein WAP55_02180 [Minisyncoccia bacterium]